MPLLARKAAASMALALATVALASCGNESDGVFDVEGFPFTFEYPDEFEETEDLSFDQELGASADQSAAVGLDDEDGIFVQRFTTEIAIDASNLNLARREIDGLIRQVSPDASSEAAEVAGLPALTADEVTIPSVEGGESSLTFFFDGNQEYLINCQSTPDHRAEIDAACEMALETLTLE